MAATIRSMLDLATCHLPMSFFQPGAPEVTGWYPLEPVGALLWVPPVAMLDLFDTMDPPGVFDGDLRPEIQAVRRYARGLGCDYVRFDCTADRNADLPTW